MARNACFGNGVALVARISVSHEVVISSEIPFSLTSAVRTRVEQLEQGLEGIVSLFSTGQQPTSSKETSTTSSVTNHVPLPSTIASSQPTEKPFTDLTSNGNGCTSGDVFDRGLLTPEDAATLCGVYIHMSRLSFPYVLLPDDMEIAKMRLERPFLLQAILTVASWRNRPLQLSLEEHFLTTFGIHFFVKADKTLDMLQGLLVYLGW